MTMGTSRAPGAASALRPDALLAEAKRRTGLSDFGDPWLMEPFEVLLHSLRNEAGMSAAGVKIEYERQTAALVNRLRFVETLRRNPQILQEDLRVAAVIVSLPRTGSTMLQRLLASAPPFTAMRWWEVFNYAPLAGEARGNPVERRRAGQKIIDGFLASNPDLISSHPYELEAAEEETPVLGQFFMGTLMEGYAYVPSYVEWLKKQDHRRVYQELRSVLQFMQWNEPARREQGWILKSSAHLASLDALCTQFPDALVVMNHRDPLQTVPSLCSLMTMLHGIECEKLDKVAVGRFIAKRWAWNLKRFTELRQRLPATRFLDMSYRGLIGDTPTEVGKVLERLGEPLDAQMAATVNGWLERNNRDKRPRHHYTLAEFGLTEDELLHDYADYRAAYAADIGKCDAAPRA